VDPPEHQGTPDPFPISGSGTVKAQLSGRGEGAFPATRWSLIRQVQEGDAPARRAGWERLCTDYWKPIYVWLRARGATPEDAEDLAQDFFCRLMAGDWLKEVTGDKGRLRTFLLVLLKRHAVNAWEYRQAKKRGGGSIIIHPDAGEGEAAWHRLPSEGASPDVMFDRHWAMQLLDRVMEELRATYELTGKAALFDELREYLSGGSAEESYAAPAARLGLSEGAVKVAAFRLRERFRVRLSEVVQETICSPEEVTEEIQYLFQVFQP
jgi:DNA-directed RNA polymerase specialized sigma24 family protein